MNGLRKKQFFPRLNFVGNLSNDISDLQVYYTVEKVADLIFWLCGFKTIRQQEIKESAIIQ